MFLLFNFTSFLLASQEKENYSRAVRIATELEIEAAKQRRNLELVTSQVACAQEKVRKIFMHNKTQSGSSAGPPDSAAQSLSLSSARHKEKEEQEDPVIIRMRTDIKRIVAKQDQVKNILGEMRFALIKDTEYKKKNMVNKETQTDSLEAECVVCKEDMFFAEEQFSQVPCGHYFHNKCWLQWCYRDIPDNARIVSKKTCPICRANWVYDFMPCHNALMATYEKEDREKRRRQIAAAENTERVRRPG